MKINFKHNSRHYIIIKVTKNDDALYVAQSNILYVYNIGSYTLLEYYDYFKRL